MADLGLPPIDVFKLVQTGDSLHHLISTKGNISVCDRLRVFSFTPLSVQRNSTEMILFFPQDTMLNDIFVALS